MRTFKNMVISGLVGIGIGMIWMAVDLVLSVNGQSIENAKMFVSSFLFWLVASFLIGVFFYLASWIFDKDQWSLRKQVVVNFFVCFAAWLLLNLYLNNWQFSWTLVFSAFASFVIMYVIAYGLYFWHLWKDVKKINQRLENSK